MHDFDLHGEFGCFAPTGSEKVVGNTAVDRMRIGLDEPTVKVTPAELGAGMWKLARLMPV